MRRLVLVILALVVAPAAFAQQEADSASKGGTSTMKDLLAKGFEIKAAAPNGAKYIVFLQKGTEAYACEFVTLTNSRCGSVN